MRERWRIAVEGIVQGVGFRPFVYGLATTRGLAGSVRNSTTGVIVEVEGAPGPLAAFRQALQQEPLALAVIARVTCAVVPVVGETTFTIANSQMAEDRRALVAPDVGTCDDCLRELLNPRDRRYLYAFINCTHCGPRWTIIHDVPYDRERTTMAVFRMCPDCQGEYEAPSNRRFHAQPNACPQCGPRLQLLDHAGGEMTGVDPTCRAAALLRQGAIVAVKGLGGYHLACDAGNTTAVSRLRDQKHREAKPFALMVQDMAAVQRLCEVSAAEEALLRSYQRPIVLLKKRQPSPVACLVAPDSRYLGVMLPYTPLHHLLLREVQLPLVMTSGNLRAEPMVYQDEAALHRLRTIADYFLLHNRAIHVPCDDSVTRVVRGRALTIRRARGYVPRPLAMPFEFVEPVLACGAQLKNTFCLGQGPYAFVSPHIGDLENYETFAAFVEGLAHFMQLFDVRPTVVAYDLHPEYLSTKYALELPGVVTVGVQHHHAHIASGMAEHGVDGPVIGVAWDGLGYGADGTLWGGEFLVADYLNCTRAAHLEYVPLPGGEQAIRQPWRMAATYLYAVYGDAMHDLDLDFVQRLDRRRWEVLQQMIQKGLHSPLTSSVGRLFDAVSCLVGGRDTVNYEGQAAVQLEALADEACQVYYPYTVEHQSRPMILRVAETIKGIVADLRRGVAPPIIAAKFHNTLAQAIAAVCKRISAQEGVSQVVLSGGVFQNALLLQRVMARLAMLGLRVYLPSQVPLNDGGLSLGQAAIANARVRAGYRGAAHG